MLNLKGIKISSKTFKIDKSDCFLTPDDVKQLADKISEIRHGTYKILDRKQLEKTINEIRKIEIITLLNRIEELAIEKIGEEDRMTWYFENILSFGEKLKNKYGESCQGCLYWQILAGDPSPRADMIIIDFTGEDSILHYLIAQQKELLNIKKGLSY